MTLGHALGVLRVSVQGGDLFEARRIAREHSVDVAKVESTTRIYGAHHAIAEGTKRILGVRR